MKKKALLAALLAMTLLLSSCALIVKDMEVDAATEILRMGDTVITKAEVLNAAESVLADMASTYASYGIPLDREDPDVVQQARTTAVERLKRSMVLDAKIEELGFGELTEEELAKAKEAAEATLENDKMYIRLTMLDNPDLEGEELDQAIEAKLGELGLSTESLLESYVLGEQDNLKITKLHDFVIKDVEVPEEEVRADFDSKVAADQETYAEDPESWAAADRKGTALYYAPAGIRRVRQILLKFKDEDQAVISGASAKVTEANGRVTAAETIVNDPEAEEEAKAQAQADLAAAQADLEAAQAELKAATDTAFEHLDEDADAVLEALAADPDSWDQLVEEKNGDPGMKAGAANAENGYAVFDGMASFDPAFVQAAMELKTVGDVSGKIRGETYGYYILKYAGDVAEGPVDYDTVRDVLHGSLLTAKQNEVYAATVDQWISEAGITENLGALKD